MINRKSSPIEHGLEKIISTADFLKDDLEREITLFLSKYEILFMYIVKYTSDTDTSIKKNKKTAK